MPLASTVISRTRQWVSTRTPLRIAIGQYVTSLDPLAPCGHPMRHVPALMHAARPSYSAVVIALSDGHQCQSSRLKPHASVSPSFPSGTGGSGSSLPGGYIGSPTRPETPIMRAFRSYQG